jgi:hypothetical protein
MVDGRTETGYPPQNNLKNLPQETCKKLKTHEQIQNANLNIIVARSCYKFEVSSFHLDVLILHNITTPSIPCRPATTPTPKTSTQQTRS